MLEPSKRARLIAGGAIGLNLLLATAAVAGVVPRPAGTETVASAAVGEPVLEPVADAGPTTTADTVAPETTTTAPPTTTAPTTAPKPKPTTPQPTEAPATTAAAPVTVAAPAVTTTTLPPRRNPSSAEVQAAMQQVRQRIGGLFTPTEAQARQLGSMICDAFDQGKSYAQVKSDAMAQVSQIPLITVTSDTADFVIRTAVQLFCPGWSSKLP